MGAIKPLYLMVTRNTNLYATAIFYFSMPHFKKFVAVKRGIFAKLLLEPVFSKLAHAFAADFTPLCVELGHFRFACALRFAKWRIVPVCRRQTAGDSP